MPGIAASPATGGGSTGHGDRALHAGRRVARDRAQERQAVGRDVNVARLGRTGPGAILVPSGNVTSWAVAPVLTNLTS